MTRALIRLASAVLLALAVTVLAGTGPASASVPVSAEQPIPIPGPVPIPSPIPDPIGIGGDGTGVFPTCMVSPVECFISGFVAALAANAAEFIGQILNDVASEATFNPSAPGFLQQYSVGFAIAVFLLCILLMRLFYRMSRHADRMPQYRESLLHYLPLGLALCATGPGLGAVLADMSNGLTQGIISATSSPDQMLSALQNSITGLQSAPTPIISILLLVAMILAAVMVIVTLLLQSLALYLTGSVMAIAFVMMIDPELRQKATKLPMSWLGILLSKPLLFFMMGAVVQLVSGGGMASDPIIGSLLAILALLLVSLAPMTLRKFAPIIPGGGDATATGAPGALVSGGADLGSTASQQQMMGARYGSGGDSSGSGGAATSQAQIGMQRSSAQSGSSGSSLMPAATPSGPGMSGSNSPLKQYVLSSGGPTGSALGTAGSTAGSAAGSAATKAGAGAAAGGAGAAMAGPLGLAAVGVKAAKDFAESAAPNIGGSE